MSNQYSLFFTLVGAVSCQQWIKVRAPRRLPFDSYPSSFFSRLSVSRNVHVYVVAGIPVWADRGVTVVTAREVSVESDRLRPGVRGSLRPFQRFLSAPSREWETFPEANVANQ